MYKIIIYYIMKKGKEMCCVSNRKDFTKVKRSEEKIL